MRDTPDPVSDFLRAGFQSTINSYVMGLCVGEDDLTANKYSTSIQQVHPVLSLF